MGFGSVTLALLPIVGYGTCGAMERGVDKVGAARRGSPTTWSYRTPRGLELMVQLATDGSLTYRITVGSTTEPWLVSSPKVPRPRVWCSGAWEDFSDAGSITEHGSTAFSFSVLYTSSGSRTAVNGNGVQLNVTFEYCPDTESFVFRQTFPLGCSNSTGLDIPTLAGSSYNSTSVPLSEFPVWDYSETSLLRSHLGYLTWAGVFAYTRASQGIGLAGYMGGSEGGPVVLFEPEVVNRPAMVMSPYEEFMSSILALRRVGAVGNTATQQCSQGGGSFETNVDYNHHDFPGSMRTNVSTAAACCTACDVDNACRAWSWIANGSLAGNCYMKWSSVGRYPANGHVSGEVHKNLVLVAGVQGRISSIPAGHTTAVVIAGAESGGVRSALAQWGASLRNRHNSTRADLGQAETMLSAWTDNGAYWFGRNKPTATDLVDTINDMINQGLPVRSLQLDPWAWDPMCNATLFVPLKELSANMSGIPFTLYTSYWCPTTSANHFQLPFLDSIHFEVFQDGTFRQQQFAQVSPNSSFVLYDRLLAPYTGNLAGYEVDFLSYYPLLVPEFRSTLDSAAVWARGMADAATKHGVNLQYCMALPSWLLQSLEFPSVTNARASDDNFPTNLHRWRIGYTAMLHWPLRLRSFMDVIWSSAVQPGNEYGMNRSNIELQVAVAALSAGPVGFGDGPKFSNTTVVMWTCTADGRLLRPSVPATPIDRMLDGDRSPTQIDDPEPEIWDAASRVGDLVFWSLLVVDVYPAMQVSFPELFLPSELAPASGWPADTSMYTVVDLARCANGTTLEYCASLVPTDGGGFSVQTTTVGSATAHDWVVLSMSPVCPSGAVLLGELGKIVAVSPDRFETVQCTNTGFVVTILPSKMPDTVDLVVSLGDTILHVQVVQNAGKRAQVECFNFPRYCNVSSI